MYEFKISIPGDRIEVSVLRDALVNVLRLLKQVEAEVAGGDAVRWRVSTLSYNSPILMGFVGEPRSRKRNARDASHIVGRAVVSGLSELERGNRPRAFNDESLEISRRLAELAGKGGADRILVMEENGHAPLPLQLSHKTVAAVEEIIGIKYEALGSIEGTLEVISARGRFTCNVYDAVTGKPVKCVVPEHLKKKVLEHFEGHVIVTGTIKRDATGQARQIVMDDIARVKAEPEAEYVSIRGIDPNFTGGMDTIKDRWK